MSRRLNDGRMINHSGPSGFSTMEDVLSGTIAGRSMDAVRTGSVFRRFIFDFLSIVACRRVAGESGYESLVMWHKASAS